VGCAEAKVNKTPCARDSTHNIWQRGKKRLKALLRRMRQGFKILRTVEENLSQLCKKLDW